MTPFWTSTEFARITGGTWHPQPPASPIPLAGVSIDTRTLQPGEAFVAIPGDRFDGHDFIPQAQQGGAAFAIAQKTGSDTVLTRLVPDTLGALHDLARAYRAVLRKRGVTVIAVLGSNGKTTTRHLIHTALTASQRGSQSPKSFNNHIGVPLTLLGAQADDDFLVLEIGTNHPGEIASLAQLATPDAVVITSIGAEHLEAFHDLEGVTREEASVLDHLTEARQVFISQQALEHFQRCDIALPTDMIVYDRGRLARTTPTETGQRLELATGNIVTLPLPGAHNASNAQAAVAVAQWMGIREAEAWHALESAEAAPMRMQRVTVPTGGEPVTILNDAYNANLDSMTAALDTLATFPNARRRVAILGDMLELGPQSEALHRKLGRRLAVDRAIVIGEFAHHVAEGMAERDADARCEVHAGWSAELGERIAAAIEPGDVVLVKASRGGRLERAVEAITDHLAGKA